MVVNTLGILVNFRHFVSSEDFITKPTGVQSHNYNKKPVVNIVTGPYNLLISSSCGMNCVNENFIETV